MKNSFSLFGKQILITGASSGIGRECAVSCVKMGAKVSLIGLELIELERTADLIGKENCRYFDFDITNYQQLESVIESSFNEFGKISGFIHSAGIGMTKPLKLLKPADFEKTFAVNVISGMEIVRILSKKKYLPEEGASYIFISSVMGKLGDIGNIAYCASKGALIPAAKAMALELSNKKIRVNCILPGVVQTEMAKKLFDTISDEAKLELVNKHPLGLGDPTDIANACVYLLSDESRWVTGSEFIVDGGYSSH